MSIEKSTQDDGLVYREDCLCRFSSINTTGILCLNLKHYTTIGLKPKYDLVEVKSNSERFLECVCAGFSKVKPI